MITDDMLVKERPHFGGVQRLYRLPNGFGLSLVNSPELHSYPFAWEAAVTTNMTAEGRFDGLSYDTPLTDDVLVFSSEEEANSFIAEAKSWAEAHQN